MDKLKGWRTVLVNVVIVLLAVAVKVGLELPELEGEDVALVVGVANLVLRRLTTTPVGKA